MADKELRKLSRKQILELLLRLTEKSESLQAELDEANRKLKNKLLIKSEAGSIAEASLKLNGVFEAAENAAEQYLYNIKVLSDNQEEIKKRIEAEYRKKARAALLETEKRCKAREAESRRRAEEIIVEARKAAHATNEEAEKKLAEVRRLYKYVTEEKRKLQKNTPKSK